MQLVNQQVIKVDVIEIESINLGRRVKVECLFPDFGNDNRSVDLLLINDGQNMEELGLAAILGNLISGHQISPLFCVAIYAGDRKMEYGTTGVLDYLGRGYKAGSYTHFVFEELLPVIKSSYNILSFNSKAFAGFSLGGLSALDIVWNHPKEFQKAGVFSGSLWWRTKALDEGYDEATDRIMHTKVRQGNYAPGLQFFFEAGAQDETMDRNNNGIIDSIDDTLGMIQELVEKGYSVPKDICYLEIQEGKHDIATWAQAMPVFLKWGWGMRYGV